VDAAGVGREMRGANFSLEKADPGFPVEEVDSLRVGIEIDLLPHFDAYRRLDARRYGRTRHAQIQVDVRAHGLDDLDRCAQLAAFRARVPQQQVLRADAEESILVPLVPQGSGLVAPG
jgi:hypothetical protein